MEIKEHATEQSMSQRRNPREIKKYLNWKPISKPKGYSRF